VQGNTIGTAAAGAAALGNLDGVRLTGGASANSIGGSEPWEGNIIASNRRHGVALLDTNTSANAVWSNQITSNAGDGVMIGTGADENFISRNVIASNGNNGIGTGAVTRNLLASNAIYENGALGIDVNSDGVTFAHLVWLTGATTSGTDTTVEGLLVGAPNATYAVELFDNAAADPSGFGEGQAPLPGVQTVSTDADGNGPLLVTLPLPLAVGHCVSATATEAGGTTWEFGNCLAVADGGASASAPGGDAARALSRAEAPRPAPPALPPRREQPPPEDVALRAGAAAVDAFFGGGAALPTAAAPRRTAAAPPGEDNSLLRDEVFALIG
jgi:hypothetical protein